MDTSNRQDNIRSSMTSFASETYTKEERLSEMFDLQYEVARITCPHKSEYELKHLRFWESLDELKRRNKQACAGADDAIGDFEEGCRNLGRLISAEIGGNRGEHKAYRMLQQQGCKGTIVRDLQLSEGVNRTELDLVVITGTAIAIVEVKNTKMDVYIDEVGDQYRLGYLERFDSQLGTKMELRKHLVQQIAKQAGVAGVDVLSLVCFTDSRISVENRCGFLTTCNLGTLSHQIDSFEGDRCIELDERAAIQKALLAASSEERYPMDYDIEGFKLSFAKALAAVEMAETALSGQATSQEEADPHQAASVGNYETCHAA
jgi:Holliday junction resolvase